MSIGAVLEVLSTLQREGCRAWVAGGWGVDALVGRQTRRHRDLDLAVDAKDEVRALQALGGSGFVIETDWRPVRVELVSSTGWVDIHPVVFDRTGAGRQADLDGGTFEYPADAFTTGVLGGQPVPCLSRAQQITFHTGYEPRPIDLHDLALLEQLPSQ
jgi:lincosamide nucleotidyltransferase A/C/D/E